MPTLTAVDPRRYDDAKRRSDSRFVQSGPVNLLTGNTDKGKLCLPAGRQIDPEVRRQTYDASAS